MTARTGTIVGESAVLDCFRRGRNGRYVQLIVPEGQASTITLISSPASVSDPIVLSIYNTKNTIVFYHVTCRDTANSPRFTVWDPHDNAFSFPFDNTRSTVTGAGTVLSPYIFTIYRLGGWPVGLALDVRARAVDAFGAETDG